jgi:hypothetical protein
VAIRFPSGKKEGKKKHQQQQQRFGGHLLVRCNLTWSNLVATKSPSRREKKTLNYKGGFGGH